MSRRTPWGDADFERVYPNGIVFAETARHGGFFVPLELLPRIPKLEQDYAEKWSGSRHWYEKDTAAYIVVLRFPEISPETQDTAIAIVGRTVYGLVRELTADVEATEPIASPLGLGRCGICKQPLGGDCLVAFGKIFHAVCLGPLQEGGIITKVW